MLQKANPTRPLCGLIACQKLVRESCPGKSRAYENRNRGQHSCCDGRFRLWPKTSDLGAFSSRRGETSWRQQGDAYSITSSARAGKTLGEFTELRRVAYQSAEVEIIAIGINDRKPVGPGQFGDQGTLRQKAATFVAAVPTPTINSRRFIRSPRRLGQPTPLAFPDLAPWPS